ncbi:Outer membrane receptor proteins, mostly Fe transport [Chitinophaga costaii]|uniref:Outer membrane receptor proteins, mostly Fe transport n=1 Tax=Chitinophaga costaii TaxID=1335309 RepID=A0A1C3YSV6_9BACT|nr:outer membrane beta-barrel protein [Chitinophaga costaii]SCB73195.1 Outer membrane receptor proteins, mostly Fe transport [Chitinophaga costaii]
MNCKRIICLLHCCFLLSIPAIAQQVGTVSGTVLAADHSPVIGARVELFKQDSVVGVIAAGEDGGFSFTKLSFGAYKLRVGAMGMAGYQSETLLVSADYPEVKVPAIVLKNDAKELKAVNITGKKDYVENKIDRTIVNVNSLASNTGANALEVLQKSPGVSVDGNDNILFKGKGGVLVLIDDKPTYLSATDLAAYLRSLPASALERIELMDNPPAQYDAAGAAGVINIRTKKTRNAGLNGNAAVSIGQSFYPQANESVNLNYRVNKINLFTSLSYGYNQAYRKLELTRDYFDKQGVPLSYINQTLYFRPKNNNGNVKAGLDYYLSPQSTLGVVYTGTYSSSKDHSPVYSNLFNGARELDSVIVADNVNNRKFSNNGFNLNYSHRFDSTGKQLNVDLDYVRYSADADQSFNNDFYSADKTYNRSEKTIANLPAAINIYTVKADYTHPFRNNAKLDAGIKSSYVSTDNAANYFNIVNNTPVVNYDITNRFLYKENINAGYLNFNKSFRRIELQLGLRAENANIEGNQQGNKERPDSTFNIHYTSLFPSAYVSYKLDTVGKNTLILSYGRRIGRPYYQDLNPFVLLSDKYTYSSGNPFLRPQFVNNFKLAFNHGSTYSFAVIYTHLKDYQSEVVQQNGNIFINSRDNIGTVDYLGFATSLSLKPANWWSVYIYADVFNNSFKGMLYTEKLDISAVAASVDFSNQFVLGKGWSADFGGYYSTKRTNSQFTVDPLVQLNAGVQKKIWKDKGVLKLSARDLFHLYENNGAIGHMPNARGTFHNIYNSEVVTLGLSYNFGKSSDGGSKRKSGSSEAEQERIRN